MSEPNRYTPGSTQYEIVGVLQAVRAILEGRKEISATRGVFGGFTFSVDDTPPKTNVGVER